MWHQNVRGIQGALEEGAAFGSALATGDFDGDGFGDLAIGVPFEDVGEAVDAGGVHVLYGSADGLAAAGSQVLDQTTAGGCDGAETADFFGGALAAADLGRTAHDDLAIGAWGETIEGVEMAGAVAVTYGASEGLTTDAGECWHQDSPGIKDALEGGEGMLGDAFGATLVAADFGKSRDADLAIAATAEDVAGTIDAGAVHVLYGSHGGISPSGDRVWHRDMGTVEGAASDFENFGIALAGGNFGRSRHADLAIGAPHGFAGGEDAGSVNVLYGSRDGITASGDDLWHQDAPGIAEKREDFDLFGSALAAVELGRSGFADLAVGVPGETIHGVRGGAITLILGTKEGLSGASELWHQAARGIPNASEDGDRFGADLDAHGAAPGLDARMVVAIPGEDIRRAEDAGAVAVMYGREGRLSSDGSELWHQGRRAVAGAAEPFDSLGRLP